MDAGEGVRSGAAVRLRLFERAEQGRCASNKLAAEEANVIKFTDDEDIKQ